MKKPLIRAGKYQHYKGGFYKAIGVAKHSETQEEMVVYKSLDSEHQLWVRPLEMFQEILKIDEKPIPRFKYLGDK